MGSVSLITARGCPYTCTWCSHSVFGFTHRRRSAPNVADELGIVARYRPDMVWYADDVFTIHHRWLRTYAEELERRGLRVPFETISREDRLNEDVVRLLARMGCFRLWIGSESGSQHVLDAMQRRTDAGRVREMVHLLQRHGIEAGMFIMLGYEGEEVADIEATVEHLKLASPDRLHDRRLSDQGHAVLRHRCRSHQPSAAWADGSDRDLTVLGRHSRRFYRHATRWMVNELASHRLRGQEGRGLPAAAEDVGERPRRPRRDAADAQRGGARAAVIVSEPPAPSTPPPRATTPRSRRGRWERAESGRAGAARRGVPPAQPRARARLQDGRGRRLAGATRRVRDRD